MGVDMLIPTLPRSDMEYARRVAEKFKRIFKGALVLSSIACSNTGINASVTSEVLFATFIYGVYSNAGEAGLKVDIMNASSMDPDKALQDARHASKARAFRRILRDGIGV